MSDKIILHTKGHRFEVTPDNIRLSEIANDESRFDSMDLALAFGRALAAFSGSDVAVYLHELDVTIIYDDLLEQDRMS